MRKILLSAAIVFLYCVTSICQQFTVRQSVTGQNDLTDIRGQSLIPSSQGVGEGSTGTSNIVYLEKFSLIYAYSSTSEADTLYLYSSIPDSISKLDNGKGGMLIGKSILKKKGDFPYTDYIFDSIELKKNLTYYFLFREDVNLEAGAGSSYSGGSAFRNKGDTLSSNVYLDLKFIATFSQKTISEIDPPVIDSTYIWDVWTKENSPYYFNKNIVVPDDSILIIEPGVEVFFNHYKLLIKGVLLAEGTVTDTIKFAAANDYWGGISIENGEGELDIMSDNDTTRLTYCEISDVINSSEGSITVRYFSKVQLKNCYIHNCTSFRGGGLYYYYSEVYITGCTIENNYATYSGGGISMSADWNTKAWLSNNIIRNNKAGDEGGAFYSYGYNMYMVNCQITKNQAVGNGGAINAIWNDGSYYNNTICDNISGGHGGGIFNYGNIKLVNTILWGNAANTGSQFYDDIGNGFAFNNCVVQNGETNSVFRNCIFYNPNLTEDYNLKSDSRCVNAGTISLNKILPFDLAGNARIYGDSIDIGAYELPVQAINRNPFAEIANEINMMYNDEQTVKFKVDDPDNDSLSFQLHCNNTNIEIKSNPITNNVGTFTINSRNNYLGKDTILFVITDNSGSISEFDSVYINLNVLSENYLLAPDTIYQNTTWYEGTVEVNNNIIVMQEATLNIQAGTKVTFTGPYKIIVQGNINAYGTADKNILFTSKDTTGFFNRDNNGWRGIVLSNTNSAVIQNCEFEYYNDLKDFDMNGSPITVNSNLDIKFIKCKFRNNTSKHCGGINVPHAKSVFIDSCLFEKNFGQYVAAVYSNSSTTLTNSHFVENYSEYFGTIYLYGRKDLVMNCLFRKNLGDPDYVSGTGISSYSDTISIINSVFENNSSALGIVEACYNKSVDIINCSFTNNKSTRSGTCLYAVNSKGRIINSLFWNPDLFNELSPNLGETVTKYSLTNCLFTNKTSSIGLDCDTLNILSANPLFNNSFTGDYTLQQNSVCINSGTNTVQSLFPNNKFIDFYGNSRKGGNTIDIGAVELFPNLPPENITLSNSIIDEKQVAPYFVAKLIVEDQNKGDKFYYHFYVPNDSILNNDKFSLSGDSLFAIQSFDYNEIKKLKIGLIAKDQHGDSLSKFFTLYTNDIPSIINITDSVIDENNPVNHTIATLNVSDNGALTYNIIDYRFKENFGFVGNKLTALKSLNYENSPENTFFLEAIDENNCKSRKLITIYVTDINEAPYGIMLSNNKLITGSQEGTLIGKITVLDEDKNDQHIVELSLQDNFNLNENKIFSSRALNMSEQNKYTITLTAVDQGNLSYSRDFTIFITDESGTVVIDNIQSSGNLLLYPNPVHDRLNINCDNEKFKRIEVYNDRGELILIRNLQHQLSEQINFEDFQNGIYLIRFIAEETSYTKRIIKL